MFKPLSVPYRNTTSINDPDFTCIYLGFIQVRARGHSLPLSYLCVSFVEQDLMNAETDIVLTKI